MLLVPFKQVTWVSGYSATAMREKFARVVFAEPETEVQPQHLFNGKALQHGFSISRRLKHADNFLPLIDVTIEAVGKNTCLVKVYFRLFFSSQLIVAFWTFASFIAVLVSIFSLKDYVSAICAVLFGFGNYAVTLANFSKNIKINLEELKKILT